MQQPLMFKLDQNPKGHGLRCDGDGLFLGRDALLQRNEKDNFEARPATDLQRAFVRVYSGETYWESRIRSVELVATALNKGEMARAMITAVLMRLPVPDFPDRIAGTDAALAKAGFNPQEPRDERGRWASLLNEAESLLSEIGRAQAIESTADRAVATAEVNSVGDALDAYGRFMEQPLGGSVPITPESPIWGYGDNMELAPERPITAGDAVNAAESLLSFLPFGEASGAADIAELAAPESEAFIIRPLELPTNFDITLPVGRYVIPANVAPKTTTYGNLVHAQIGELVQDSFPNVQMILRTVPANVRGVDIEIPDIRVSGVGFQYAEIKALTDDGFRSFNTQVARWKLSDPVLAITYDYQGNIYYGFPW